MKQEKIFYQKIKMATGCHQRRYHNTPIIYDGYM